MDRSKHTPPITVNVDQELLYQHYLTIVSVMLELNNFKGFTGQEKLILAEFLKINEELPTTPELVFSSKMRERVCKNLGITTSNLTNYISYLKTKKAILQDNQGNLRLNSNIVPKVQDGTIFIGFELTVKQ